MQIIYNKLLKGGSGLKIKPKTHVPQMQKLTTKQKFMAFGASAKKTGNKYIVDPIKSTYKAVKTVVVAPLKYTEQLARVAVSVPGMAGKKVYRKIQKWGLKSNLASSQKKIDNYESVIKHNTNSGQSVNKNLMANYVKHTAKVDLIKAKLALRKERIKNNHTLFINRINPMHSIKSIYNGSKYTNATTTIKRDDSVLGALLGRSARTSSNNLTKKHTGEMTAVEKAKFAVLEKKSNLNATLVNKIYSDIIPGEKHSVSQILVEPDLINTYRLALEKKKNDNTMTLDDTKLYNILRRKLLLNSQAEVKPTLKPKNTAQNQATPRTEESIANASHAIIQRKYNKIQANQQIKANAAAADDAAAINKQKQEDYAAAAAQKQLELQQAYVKKNATKHINVSAQQQIQEKLNIGTNLHTSTEVNNFLLKPLNQPVSIPAAPVSVAQAPVALVQVPVAPVSTTPAHQTATTTVQNTQHAKNVPAAAAAKAAQAHEKKGLFSKFTQSSLQKLQNTKAAQELALQNTKTQIIKKKNAHTNKRKELNIKRQKIEQNLKQSKTNLQTKLNKLKKKDSDKKPNNKSTISNYNKYQYFTRLGQRQEQDKLTRQLADMKKKIEQHDKKKVNIPETANAKTQYTILDPNKNKMHINSPPTNISQNPIKPATTGTDTGKETEKQTAATATLNTLMQKNKIEPLYSNSTNLGLGLGHNEQHYYAMPNPNQVGKVTANGDPQYSHVELYSHITNTPANPTVTNPTQNLTQQDINHHYIPIP
jgi:hypothetical protein